MITSEDVSSEYRLKSFVFHSKAMFRLQDTQVFQHLMIYQASYVITSIST